MNNNNSNDNNNNNNSDSACLGTSYPVSAVVPHYLPKNDIEHTYIEEMWSARYVMILWLSVLVLLPYDFQILDSSDTCEQEEEGEKEEEDKQKHTCRVLKRIINMAKIYLQYPSKEREAAAFLLAKLFQRPDVHGTNMACSFLEYCKQQIWENYSKMNVNLSSSFTVLGILQTVNEICKVMSLSDALKYRRFLYDIVFNFDYANPTSLIRKLRVSCSCRIGIYFLKPNITNYTHIRSFKRLMNYTDSSDDNKISADISSYNINNNNNNNNNNYCGSAGNSALLLSTEEEEKKGEDEKEEEICEEVENIIDFLLGGLTDNDISVRWSSAKGIGRVLAKMQKQLAEQVVESIIELIEGSEESEKVWNGCCLVFAEMIRRGILSPDTLTRIVPFVIQALQYELRRGRYVVGSSVRDAACFVCWSLARAYSAEDLKEFSDDLSVAILQLALFDSDVNCRRGASAAFQEHVGRNQLFKHGLYIITNADYFSLSNTRNSYLVVCPKIARFPEYADLLIKFLVAKKLRHTDFTVRILAAKALKIISKISPDFCLNEIMDLMLSELFSTKEVESQHGNVLGISAVIDALHPRISTDRQTELRNLIIRIEKVRLYKSRGGELIREAVCTLIESLAKATGWEFKERTAERYTQTLLECARHFTQHVQVAAAEALKALCQVRFSPEGGRKLLEELIKKIKVKNEQIAARRGYILFFGCLPNHTVIDYHSLIIEILCEESMGKCISKNAEHFDAQSKQFALLSLLFILRHITNKNKDARNSNRCLEHYEDCHTIGGNISNNTGNTSGYTSPNHNICSSSNHKENANAHLSTEEWKKLINTLQNTCEDFEYDNRGDIGSIIRELTMETVVFILENFTPSYTYSSPLPSNYYNYIYAETKDGEGEPKTEIKADNFCLIQKENSDDIKNTQNSHNSNMFDSQLDVCKKAKKGGEYHPNKEDIYVLFKCIFRNAYEKLDRVRGRTCYLLFRLVYPFFYFHPNRYQPFQADWVWNRVHYGESYEITHSFLPLENADSICSPPACSSSAFSASSSSPSCYTNKTNECSQMTHQKPHPSYSCLPTLPPHFDLIQKTLLDIHYTHFNNSCTYNNESNERCSDNSNYVHASPDAQTQGGKAEEIEMEENQKDNENEIMNNTDFRELCLLYSHVGGGGGGYASMQKMNKSSVMLRIPVWTDIEVTYKYMLPFLLCKCYMREGLKGIVRTLGGGVGCKKTDIENIVIKFIQSERNRRVTMPDDCWICTKNNTKCTEAKTQPEEDGRENEKEEQNREEEKLYTETLSECFVDEMKKLSEDTEKNCTEIVSFIQTAATFIINDCIYFSYVKDIVEITEEYMKKTNRFQDIKISIDLYVSVFLTRHNILIELKKKCMAILLFNLLHRYPAIRQYTAEKIYGLLIGFDENDTHIFNINTEEFDEVINLITAIDWRKPPIKVVDGNSENVYLKNVLTCAEKLSISDLYKELISSRVDDDE